MASPMAVPPPAWMSAIAFSAAALSRLGALAASALSENVTTPTEKPDGRFLTNVCAACARR